MCCNQQNLKNVASISEYFSQISDGCEYKFDASIGLRKVSTDISKWGHTASATALEWNYMYAIVPEPTAEELYRPWVSKHWHLDQVPSENF